MGMTRQELLRRRKTWTFKRPLVKLTGEICGSHQEGDAFESKQVAEIHRIFKKFRGPVVIGGGNVVRGASLRRDFEAFSGPEADHIGMMVTQANGIFLRQVLSQIDVPVTVMSALGASEKSGIYAYNFISALEILKRGDTVLVLVGGIGTPGFTTDTAAVARAYELGCDVVVKLTQADGIYTADPKIDSGATLIPSITHADFLRHGINKIVDRAAVLVGQEQGIPIVVSNRNKPNAIERAKKGDYGSIIYTWNGPLQVRGKVA